MKSQDIIKSSFNLFLSTKTKKRIEKVILSIAIISYIIHLLFILANTQGFISFEQKFLLNPIAAIYTPFSFILVYEVYLLIFHLPNSITVYIGKQYEIISLIVIRRIFKDIAEVKLTPDWFQDSNDLQFTFDVLTSLILFFIIFQFYRSIKKKDYKLIGQPIDKSLMIQKFINLKKILAIILVPILAILAIYTLFNWGYITFFSEISGVMKFKKINNIFFDDFFTVLIITDVLLLLFSFFYSDKFHKTIRNSGFVISTILIKVSFLTEGIVNNLLIISAVLFGYLILVIHNLYEKNDEVTMVQDIDSPETMQ